MTTIRDGLRQVPARTRRRSPRMCRVAPVLLLVISMCAVPLQTFATADGQAVAGSSVPPMYLHRRDPDGITTAIRAGNADVLKDLAQTAGRADLRSYAWAGYYRSIFMLAESSRYARDCYQAAMDILPGSLVQASDCAELLAGNYSLSGSISEWARTMQMMHDQLYAIAVASVHYKNLVFPGFGRADEMIEMRKFYDFPDEQSLTGQDENIIVPRVVPPANLPGTHAPGTEPCPLHIRCFGTSLYDIRVRVNGNEVTAVIDTGASASAVTPSEAAALGIDIVQSPYYVLKSPRPGVVPAKLGYIKSLRISTQGGAPIVLNDSKVMVGGKPAPYAKLVLGMNVLDRLGRMLIERKRMVVNPVLAAGSCSSPLHIASTLWGDVAMFFRLEVNRRLQDVGLDTGENQYLFGTARATAIKDSGAEMKTTEHHVTGTTEAIYYPSHTSLRIGDKEIESVVAVFPDYQARFPYVMGVDILRNYAVLLNFRNEIACMIPDDSVVLDHSKHVRMSNRAVGAIHAGSNIRGREPPGH